MLTILLILCVLIWLPILFYQIIQRGFWVLVLWLAIAPVATNLVHGRANPFFSTYKTDEVSYVEQEVPQAQKWRDAEQNATLKEFISQPSRIFFGAFLVVILLRSFLGKKYVLQLDRTERWMIIFTLILLANIFLQSQRLPYSMRTAMDAFIIPFSAYYTARRLVISEECFAKLIQILGYIGFSLILMGLLERLSYPSLFYRLEGPFSDGNSYYSVMVVVFYAGLLSSVCYRHYTETEQPIPRGIQWFLSFLTPVIICLTWSRGNWIGFFLGGWVFFFLRYQLINHKQKLGSIGIVLLLIPMVAIGAQLFLSVSPASERVLDEDTVTWRFKRWSVAIEENAKHPLFGIGFLNLRDILGQKVGSAYSVHNFFLGLLAELGVVGLLAYLAIVLSLVRTGLGLYKGIDTRDRWRGIAILATVVAHVGPAFFADTIQNAGIWLVYLYVFIGGIVGLADHRRLLSAPSRPLGMTPRSNIVASTARASG